MKDGDNIYGVSYRQNTADSHTVQIEDNTVFGDTKIAVYLLESDDSKVKNNTVISTLDDAKTGDDSFRKGDRPHTNTEDEGNLVIREEDYYRNLNPNVEGNGDSDDTQNPLNPWIHHDGDKDNSESNPAVNPTIPGYNPTHGITDGNGSSANTDFIDDGGSEDGDVQGTIDDDRPYNGHTTHANADGKNREHSNNNGIDKVNNNTNSNDGTIASNSTDASPGLNGNDPIGKSPDSSSQGEVESSAKKAFQLNEIMDFAKDNTFEMILLIIGAIILLIVGYKRKNTFLR